MESSGGKRWGGKRPLSPINLEADVADIRAFLEWAHRWADSDPQLEALKRVERALVSRKPRPISEAENE